MTASTPAASTALQQRQAPAQAVSECLIWLDSALKCKDWHWDADQRACAQGALDAALAQQAEAAPVASAEPMVGAIIKRDFQNTGIDAFLTEHGYSLPPGTKLYAAPVAQAAPAPADDDVALELAGRWKARALEAEAKLAAPAPEAAAPVAKVTCPGCNGIGTWIGQHDGYDDADCSMCDGAGKVAAPVASQPAQSEQKASK